MQFHIKCDILYTGEVERPLLYSYVRGVKVNIVDEVRRLVLPGLEPLGLDLWDVEFKKEGAEYYLRIYIDKPNGVSIEDCEKVNAYIEPILDETDPISQSYYLEVSSAVLIRELRTDAHLSKFLGSTVQVHMYKRIDNMLKVFDAILLDFDDKTIQVKVEECVKSIDRSLISKIKVDLL